jgi:hypothetical protein
MSVSHGITIWCDAKVDAETDCPEWFERYGQTLAATRADAEAQGWQTGAQDFCPRHRTPGWKRRKARTA